MNTDKEKQNILDELTKYKEDNSLLKKKLKSLESIIEESATAIIIGNNKGQIVEANKKAQDLTQYNQEELCKKKLSELLISEDIPESFSRKNPKEPSDEFSSEQILVRKNEKKLYVAVHTKLLTDNRYQILINNINTRKKAELALIESEKRYRLLTENIHDAVWTASKNLKIVYISSSIFKITEYTSDVYYVKPLHEIVTPISYQLIRETFRKESKLWRTGTIATSNRTISLEIKLIHKKCANIWVELIATIIQNQFGKPTLYQGVVRNIDAQKKAQEILAKKKQHYDFALRSTESGVWELGADLTKINIDENLLSILGYNSAEISPLLNDWINLTVKRDRRHVIDILQDLLDGNKTTMSYECRRVHKSGEILWFSDYVEAIVDENGKVTELIGTSKNISKEKITEEKKFKYYAGLQILTDSAFQLLNLPDLDSIYDFAGKILLQNISNSIIIFSHINPETNESRLSKFYGINEPKLYQLLDNIPFVPYESTITLSQKEIFLLRKKILIEYDGGFQAFINSVFPEKEAKQINNTFKFDNIHIIGITRHDEKLTGSISIVLRENAKIYNKEFIEAFINLTSIIINRKNIETELKNLSLTKDKFFSIISHDLKNPFNTFIGFSGLILQDIDSISKEKILEFSKLIHDGAVQSYDMMQNLFDWVSTQKGSIVVRPVQISLPGLINSIIKLFSSEASKKNIKLSLKTTTEINFIADIDMTNAILRNLVSNALKFTKKGGKVEVNYSCKNGMVQFEIADNGIGIPKEKQAQLFNVHTNKSTPGTDSEKGTGLGLILCREFVELLGGKIWVESEVGRGTCFSFIIPERK